MPELKTPYPLCSSLPTIYQEDNFTRRFTEGLDSVVAPVFWTLDSLTAYFDPQLAPHDFLKWLGGWVGVTLDQAWPPDRRRAMVGRAVALYRRRSTVGGLNELLELYTGAEVEILDSGGSSWSPIPGGELPGTPEQRITVRVTLPSAAPSELRRLREFTLEAVPAHVAVQIEHSVSSND